MTTKTSKDSEILEVTQIKIKLGDKKEITLSSDEARKVYEELGKLFKLEQGKNLCDKLNDILDRQKQREYIPYPIYIEKWPVQEPYYEPWKIWYGSSTTAGNPNAFDATTTCLSINLDNNKTIG